MGSGVDSFRRILVRFGKLVEIYPAVLYSKYAVSTPREIDLMKCARNTAIIERDLNQQSITGFLIRGSFCKLLNSFG